MKKFIILSIEGQTRKRGPVSKSANHRNIDREFESRGNDTRFAQLDCTACS